MQTSGNIGTPLINRKFITALTLGKRQDTQTDTRLSGMDATSAVTMRNKETAVYNRQAVTTASVLLSLSSCHFRYNYWPDQTPHVPLFSICHSYSHPLLKL